jgi:hypothetical protein
MPAPNRVVCAGVAPQKFRTVNFLVRNVPRWQRLIAGRLSHSALTLAQKSKRLLGILDRSGKGRRVSTSEEETGDGPFIAR